MGLYRREFLWTREELLDEDGEPDALELREWWYMPSFEVSEVGGERGSYMCGEAGGNPMGTCCAGEP